ncbi:MAG: nucleotide exchange factor GrpE [Desulfobacteraceae bacterium]|nr:MAG: nucleotide exchange factor GrpE [Desulfobacteraceae bacterium]
MTDKSTKKKNVSVETEAPAEDVNAPQSDETASEKTAADETSGLDPLTMKLNALEQEAAQDRDRLLRVSAEFDNYKKRMARQMDDFKKYANEALLKDLLNVVDNLERAISTSAGAIALSPNASEKESVAECVREGVEMTLSEVVKILNQYHVTVFDAMGKPFDPAYHEAVMQEASDAHPDNTVINVFQKGYLLHDRLLRPAMVVVSKKN